MEKDLVQQLARELWQAEKEGKPLKKLTERYSDITIDDAYAIQLFGRRLREEDGQRMVGAKIAMTSKATQEQFKAKEPAYGYILADMIAAENEPLKMTGKRAPKVEAEVAFVLSADLQGPGISIADVLRSTEGVIAALEIIDTRYEGLKGLTAEDLIADSALISEVVLGGKMVSSDSVDLRHIGAVFEKNGEVISTAAGAAILGNPATAVAWLANKLSTHGLYLRKGDVIISGSLISPCAVEAGDFVRATFDGLGSVSARFR